MKRLTISLAMAALIPLSGCGEGGEAEVAREGDGAVVEGEGLAEGEGLEREGEAIAREGEAIAAEGEAAVEGAVEE